MLDREYYCLVARKNAQAVFSPGSLIKFDPKILEMLFNDNILRIYLKAKWNMYIPFLKNGIKCIIKKR